MEYLKHSVSGILSGPLATHLRTGRTTVMHQSEKYGPFASQHLVRRPPVTILACFSIFYLFLIQYCRHANYRDPTSYFFDPGTAYKPIYSAVRIKEVDAFIESAETLPRPRTSGEPLTMCIGVATVKRDGEQYVRRTIGSLMEGLSEEERRTLYLTILIGHTEPSQHPIYAEKWNEHLPNKVLKYKKEDIPRVQQWEADGLYRNKTVFDYAYLLNDCYATGAKYIAMIEDDTLAVEGWYPRALEALRDIEDDVERRVKAAEHRALKQAQYGQPVEAPKRVEWAYLRLFYTEALFGWNSENWRFYLFWSFTTWAIMTTSLVLVRPRIRSRTAQTFLSNPCILAISGVCIPALIGLFFMAGRNSVSPVAPGTHEMDKFGCCSQGYVFPRDIIPRLLEWSHAEANWLVDVMVEYVANEEGWVRWAKAPALLQHIGAISSKGFGFEHVTKQHWNFGFELYKKSRLATRGG